jgi:hypothetical protein
MPAPMSNGLNHGDGAEDECDARHSVKQTDRKRNVTFAVGNAGGPVGPRAAASFRLRSFERLRVRSLGMFLRKLAMFFGGRGMVLGLIVLTARVVVLGLMVVMRGCMVVAGRGVMMLLRRM